MFVLKLSGIQIDLFLGMDEESFKAKRDTMFFKTPEAGKSYFVTIFHLLYAVHKRYSKIDKHLAWHFRYNGACLSSPPLFLCSQIVAPFSNSMILTNQGTGLPTVECGICIPLF